jgi:type VI protein secretion system component Hcp
VYYACLKKGELTNVGTSKPDKCRKGKIISWNKEGRPGAQGPQGVQGAQGQPGEPGVAGPPGPGVAAAPDLVCDTLGTRKTDGDSTLDMYLRLDGIPGDAISAKHKGETEITSFCLAGPTSPDAGVFTVEKIPDSSSIGVLKALSEGGTVANATVSVHPHSNPDAYMMKYDFTGLKVTGFRFGGHDTWEEDVSFSWSTATLTPYAQGAGGVWNPGTPVTLNAPKTTAQTQPVCDAMTATADPVFAPQFDGFLKIAGVTGGAADAKHKGEMEIRAICFGASRPGAPASYTSVYMSKNGDIASPVLQQLAGTGEKPKSAQITMRRKTGFQNDLYRIVFTEPRVDAVRTGGRGGPRHDDLALSYGTATVSFIGQNTDGTAKPPVSITLTR